MFKLLSWFMRDLLGRTMFIRKNKYCQIAPLQSSGQFNKKLFYIQVNFFECCFGPVLLGNKTNKIFLYLLKKFLESMQFLFSFYFASLNKFPYKNCESSAKKKKNYDPQTKTNISQIIICLNITRILFF